MSAPYSPRDCARECESLIRRLLPKLPQEWDYWRAYAAREIETVLSDDAKAKAMRAELAELEKELRKAECGS